ncbi:MAG TPA: DNA-directed DNA polymerase [Burkholderiaceae bacterium]|jgi:DNA polymerase-4
MTLRALYVDFNSYFASVEQQLRPELRGKPIGVLPVLAETTCCIAASVEAKRFDVKTGTSVRDARKLCRDIILVEARPATYVEMHHKLVAAVESCLHVEQIRSIDEMWCRLRGSDAQRDKAIWLAQEIKHAIYKAGGSEMRCSIGIGPNRFLAKTASNMQKPNGLVVIEQAELPQRLFGLKLRDLNGIGHSMEARLEASDIHTVEQLCAASAWQLRKAWRGVAGERFHAMLHGHDVPEFKTERNSIGHSHVLPPQLRNKDAAYAVLHRLLQKAAMRLRSVPCIAGQLCVRVRMKNRQHELQRWRRDIALDPTSDTRTLLYALDHIWAGYPAHAEALGWFPFAVGVVLCELQDAANETGALFRRAQGAETRRLDAALDALNLRFGKNTLYFGGASSALTAAPMRIAFNHVPDMRVESDE